MQILIWAAWMNQSHDKTVSYNAPIILTSANDPWYNFGHRLHNQLYCTQLIIK